MKPFHGVELLVEDDLRGKRRGIATLALACLAAAACHATRTVSPETAERLAECPQPLQATFVADTWTKDAGAPCILTGELEVLGQPSSIRLVHRIPPKINPHVQELTLEVRGIPDDRVHRFSVRARLLASPEATRITAHHSELDLRTLAPAPDPAEEFRPGEDPLCTWTPIDGPLP